MYWCIHSFTRFSYRSVQTFTHSYWEPHSGLSVTWCLTQKTWDMNIGYSICRHRWLFTRKDTLVRGVVSGLINCVTVKSQDAEWGPCLSRNHCLTALSSLWTRAQQGTHSGVRLCELDTHTSFSSTVLFLVSVAGLYATSKPLGSDGKYSPPLTSWGVNSHSLRVGLSVSGRVVSAAGDSRSGKAACRTCHGIWEPERFVSKTSKSHRLLDVYFMAGALPVLSLIRKTLWGESN